MERHRVAFKHLLLGNVGYRRMQLFEVVEIIEHGLGDDVRGLFRQISAGYNRCQHAKRCLRGVGAFVHLAGYAGFGVEGIVFHQFIHARPNDGGDVGSA